jgi:hypothetical protein
MALVTEDGTGLPTAESYLSVADADTYWSNRGNAVWAAADTADKEVALRKATQYLDTTFIWIGVLADTAQALNWPRSGADDAEGRNLVNEVPVLVKNATAELALAALSAELLVTTSRDDRAKRVKAGSVEVEFEAGVSSQKSYTLAERMLAPLVVGRYGGGAVIGLQLS